MIRTLGELFGESEGVGDIVGDLIFLGILLFGTVMAMYLVAAGVLHLARRDIKRSPSGFGLVIDREPEY